MSVQSTIHNHLNLGLKPVISLIAADDGQDAIACQSCNELRALVRHVHGQQEEERIYLARATHDDLGQSLALLKFRLAALSAQLAQSDGQMFQKVDDLMVLTDTTLMRLQRLIASLRPLIFEEICFVAALELMVTEFANEAGLDFELDLPEQWTIRQPDLTVALYRIAQEALTNIVHHAKASQIQLSLQLTATWILLLIQDDGCGFDANLPFAPASVGILEMRERLAPHQGKLQVVSTPGEGTTVRVEIPWTSALTTDSTTTGG